MLHGQACAELEERLTRPIDEFIQEGSPGWVSDGAIHVHEASLTQVFACMSGAHGMQVRTCMSTVQQRSIGRSFARAEWSSRAT